jgi:2-polyprenyl-3-methyl-5-hydroxy-6-metoxy-1,4-benzoquinol methylase
MHFVHCPLCGSKRTAPSLQAIDYITQSQHRLFNCSECGLAYVNPQPRKDDIGIFYPVTYYGGNPFAYEKIDACFRWRKIRALGLKPGKALDCGCGKGLLLGRLKAHGWNVCGTELSEMSANYGREKLGIEICSTSLEECRYSNDEFDLITLFHSLEHFPDPFRALKEIVRILKPHGLLIV